MIDDNWKEVRELRIKLVEDFRELFGDRGARDVSYSPGWDELLRGLLTQIRELGVPVCISQIKEKFGWLRIYAHAEGTGGSAKLDELINAAELKASRTCEECGKEGHVRKQLYWLKALCDECLQAAVARNPKCIRAMTEEFYGLDNRESGVDTPVDS